jgi:hypothetical protein
MTILNVWELDTKHNMYDFREMCAKLPTVKREFERCDSLQARLRCIRRLSSICTFVKEYVINTPANPPINIAASLWRTIAIGCATGKNKKWLKIDTKDDLVRLMKQCACEGVLVPPEKAKLPAGLDVFAWDRQETRQWRDGCVEEMTDIFHKTMDQGIEMSPLVVDRGSATKCNVWGEGAPKLMECGPKFLYRERNAEGHLVEHLERLGYRSLAGMIRAYADLIAEEHGITAKWIFDSNNIVLIHYDQYVGIPSHIDNITYTTGGPIYAAGIGPASSLFDMIPATVDGTPVRLEVPELSAIRLDGEARFQWSHSIPFGFNGIKFTILFRLDMLPNTRGKLDPFLQVYLPNTEEGVVDHDLVSQMSKQSVAVTQHYGIKTKHIDLKVAAVKARFVDFWRSFSKDPTLELMCSDEESRHITNPKDAQQMCKAMASILHSWPRRMHFVDCFACVGSDALAASAFLGPAFLLDVLCVQPFDAEPGRLARLQHNTTCAMETAVPIITFAMDIKRFLTVFSATLSGGDTILYMDPPWDSLDISSFIDTNVLIPWSVNGWKKPALVCLKIPTVMHNMAELLGDRLGGEYESAGNLHVRSKYFFSFFKCNAGSRTVKFADTAAKSNAAWQSI